MEIISSKQTFFVKRVFPVIWFGFILVIVLTTGFKPWKEQPFAILPLLFMVGVGFFIFRKFVWDLADEVEDHGDYLRVRKGSVNERVKLADVMNVSMSQFTNPPRLTLRLRKPSAFGDEIVFVPQAPVLRLNPFARNAIAERLIQRIDQLRNNGVSR